MIKSLKSGVLVVAPELVGNNNDRATAETVTEDEFREKRVLISMDYKSSHMRAEIIFCSLPIALA